MPDTKNASHPVLSKVEAALRILLALAFLAAGGAKLFDAAPMIQVFDQVGVGQWFRYVTGLLEVSGALMLVFRPTRLFGALVLAAVSLGATAAHLTVLGGSPVPALVLLTLCGLVVWMHRLLSTSTTERT